MAFHYINGQLVKSNSTETIDVYDPATEEVIGTVPRGTVQDAEMAAMSAKSAFRDWQRTSANLRATMLHEAAAKMRAHKEHIVRLLTMEEGKPIPENEEEFEWVT